MRKFLLLFSCFIAYTAFTFAQATGIIPDEKLNAMENHGKIYVVLIVCLVILAGLIGYLFLLDRRISKIEQQKD
jgi:hypothetical protein